MWGIGMGVRGALVAIVLVGVGGASMPGRVAPSPTVAEDRVPPNSERNPGDPGDPRAIAKRIEMPEGFVVTPFTSEPVVRNPIAMAWDGRGRLWIAENYTYAERSMRFDLDLKDRVLILEDVDGDGLFEPGEGEPRTVFTEEVQRLTGLEIGHGGTWLMCPPQLLFVPDADGDDVPDGPPTVVLDGFEVATENHHNFANGLRFGPDGWLYGRCGASCPGLIGAPGTPDADRQQLVGGIWRYHPTRGDFEVLASGTTNPWGHDWNAVGEAFFINTVNGHLWHIIPGAHHVRPHTMDPNRHVYELIDFHADHWHFDTGKSWMDSRDGAANSYGGGHAHSGATIYLGDDWPEIYRDRLLTLNFHGRRINQEVLERQGSGYLARHREDLFLSPDPWFRGIELGYGPDGGVFVLDWSDTGECHENTGVHRTSGRIYKITYGPPETKDVGDLRDLPAVDLVDLHRHPNAWFVRQARLILNERAAVGTLDDEAARDGLSVILDQTTDPLHRVRALMSLGAAGLADHDRLVALLNDDDEHIRTWAVRFLTDAWPLDGVVGPTRQAERRRDAVLEAYRGIEADLLRLAQTDPSGLVRLTLASTLQRLPVSERSALAVALAARPEDADDHNLPLMVWYGLIPVADERPGDLLPVAKASAWPTTRRLIARRLAETIGDRSDAFNDLLRLAAEADSPDLALDVLDGMTEALRGLRKARPPAHWVDFNRALVDVNDPAVQTKLRDLNVLFGDGRALDDVRRIALDDEADLQSRIDALETLIASRPDDLRDLCKDLLTVRHLNLTAAKGLTLFDDPAIGLAIVENYRRFRAHERPGVVALLVSRPAFVPALLDRIAEGAIDTSALTPYHIRQIHSYGDPGLTSRTTEVWGSLGTAPEEKQRTIAELRDRLTAEVLGEADPSHGRALFNAQCSSCHILYGIGQQVGPNLTGSGRHDLDYLLENIVTPSAVVSADYRMSVLFLLDGRVLNGLITERNERTITLRTLDDTLTIARDDIEEMLVTDESPMPAGLLENLQADEVRDLIRYLQTPVQVPLPEDIATDD